MNLYNLLNNYWKLQEQYGFDGNTCKLYFYLLYLANKFYWQEFGLGDKYMAAQIGISLHVLKAARDRLGEAKLISFVSGGGHRVKSKYQILTPKFTPKSAIYNNINTKDKNNNDVCGKKKGFVCRGSDFD